MVINLVDWLVTPVGEGKNRVDGRPFVYSAERPLCTFLARDGLRT